MFNGLLSDIWDGPTRVMLAQTRTPLGDRNGREPQASTPASPSKADLKKIIANQANQLAQHKAQTEKNKKRRVL